MLNIIQFYGSEKYRGLGTSNNLFMTWIHNWQITKWSITYKEDGEKGSGSDVIHEHVVYEVLAEHLSLDLLWLEI